MPKAANRNGYASRVNILKYVKVADNGVLLPCNWSITNSNSIGF
jgi:hypothetical protein